MPLVLIVETNGTIKELAMKQYAEEDLYKRAGFKTSDGFKLHCTFVAASGTIVRLYGKSVGKANRENKYEFPPPVDQTLFFGSCLLMAMDATTMEPIDFPKAAWETLYVQLHGGFDDLDEVGGDEDDAAADAADAAADAYANTLELGLTLTKEGYAKDGFIVDDDNNEDSVDEVDDDDVDDTDVEEYFAPPPAKRNRKNVVKPDVDGPQTVNVDGPQTVKPKPKPKRVSKPKGTAAATGKDRSVPVMMFTDQDNLKEEAYIA